MNCVPERFGLYLVLTDPVAGYERCTEAAAAAGIRYVQLRMKLVPRRQVREMALRLRAITCGSSTRLIVNDDPELACEVGADGVHLGQDDGSLPVLRARYPQLGIWGQSTHNEAQARAAAEAAPTYIGVGPVYPTPSKAKADPQLGLTRLARILEDSSLTTVAIGGINEQTLPAVLRAGAVNFAVIRAVCQASDPAAAIRRLLDICHARCPH